MLLTDDVAELEAVSPTVPSDPGAPPANHTPLKEVADELRGRCPTRRYPKEIVQSIVANQPIEIAFQVYVGTTPGRMLTCYRLEHCQSHAILQITVDDDPIETGFALPTFSEASHLFLYRIIGALETETQLDVVHVDASVREVLATTVPQDLEPALERVLDAVDD